MKALFNSTKIKMAQPLKEKLLNLPEPVLTSAPKPHA